MFDVAAAAAAAAVGGVAASAAVLLVVQQTEMEMLLQLLEGWLTVAAFDFPVAFVNGVHADC